MTQVVSAPAEKSATVKPHPPHVPKDEGSKQNVPPQSSQSEWITDQIVVSLIQYYNRLFSSVLVLFVNLDRMCNLLDLVIFVRTSS